MNKVCFKHRRITALMVVFSIIIGLLFIVNANTKVDAAQSTLENSIISGDYYYIKNVRSGKYLDAYGGNSADGTNIIQYHYTGNQNQKWRITYNSTGGFGGLYHITSAMDNTKAIAVTSTSGDNGVNIVLKTKQNNVSFYYSIQRLNNSSYKLLTNASNSISAVTVQNASCDDGANVFQYHFNNTDNDSWLIEPVSYYNANYGKEYAYSNWNAVYGNHISTYPLLDDSDCANFVSQCLCAGGKHYLGNWYINKKNNVYLDPFHNVDSDTGIANLNYTWTLSDPSPWISAIKFETYWSSRVPNSVFTYSDISNDLISSSESKIGDAIQLLKKTNYSFPESLLHPEFEAFHTTYVTKNPTYNKLGYYGLTYHSGNHKDELLKTIVLNVSDITKYKVRVYSM